MVARHPGRWIESVAKWREFAGERFAAIDLDWRRRGIAVGEFSAGRQTNAARHRRELEIHDLHLE